MHQLTIITLLQWFVLRFYTTCESDLHNFQQHLFTLRDFLLDLHPICISVYVIYNLRKTFTVAWVLLAVYIISTYFHTCVIRSLVELDTILIGLHYLHKVCIYSHISQFSDISLGKPACTRFTHVYVRLTVI